MLSAAVAVSCAIDPIPDLTETSGQGQTLTIQAVLDDSSDAAETKTVRNENGSVSWQIGDRISLFFGRGSNGGSAFATTDSGKTASFTGTIEAFTAGGEDFDGGIVYFWGLYPYDAAATCNNTSVTTNIPSTQRGVAGTFSPGQHMTLARSENLLMSFKSVCSGLRFSLQTEGVESAVFHPIADEAVVGDITVSISDGLPVVTSMRNTSSEITLVPDGGAFEVGKDYYFEFAPFTAASGFEVTLYKGNQQATFTFGTSRTFARNKYTWKTNLDVGLEWTIRQGNIDFEDANFKAYCVENFDTDADGEISYVEADNVTYISVGTDNISSLHGIEYFTNLTGLFCGGSWKNDHEFYGQLTELDLKSNRKLRTISCGHNQIESLDISNCKELEHLDCEGNKISVLDVSEHVKLVSLIIQQNNLSNIDVRNLSGLTFLCCKHNPLGTLDVSNNVYLQTLECSDNLLNSLDIINLSRLNNLECRSNNLTSLDVTKNTALKALSCEGNQLTSLDVSNNTALTALSCEGNQLTSLDVSKNTALTYLNCRRNPFLAEIWISPGQTVNDFSYDINVTTIKYKVGDTENPDDDPLNQFNND